MDFFLFFFLVKFRLLWIDDVFDLLMFREFEGAALPGRLENEMIY